MSEFLDGNSEQQRRQPDWSFTAVETGRGGEADDNKKSKRKSRNKRSGTPADVPNFSGVHQVATSSSTCYHPPIYDFRTTKDQPSSERPMHCRYCLAPPIDNYRSISNNTAVPSSSDNHYSSTFVLMPAPEPQNLVAAAPSGEYSGTTANVSGHSRGLQSDAREIRRLIKSYVARLQDKDSNSKVMMEWRIVARVLDRMFFIVYVSIIIISLATIFPKNWRHTCYVHRFSNVFQLHLGPLNPYKKLWRISRE